jgi:hypothetical protein
MDDKDHAFLSQLWTRYRRIMRYLWLATLAPVIMAGVLIYRNEKIFAAKAYVMVAMAAALVMLTASIWLIISYFRRK